VFLNNLESSGVKYAIGDFARNPSPDRAKEGEAIESVNRAAAITESNLFIVAP
jgi:hypothetical protein